MYNKAQLSKDRKLAKEPKKLARPKDKFVIPGAPKVDPNGYWDPANVGRIIEVPLNEDSRSITMSYPDGTPLDQPLIGVGTDTGMMQYMMPGQDYMFPYDSSVMEHPIMDDGEYMDLDDDEIALYRAGGYVIEELPQQDNGGVYSKDIQYPAKHNPANSFTVTDPRSMQDGGGYEIELTDEEIDQYRKGGYVVEELPQAAVGMNVRPLPVPPPASRTSGPTDPAELAAIMAAQQKPYLISPGMMYYPNLGIAKPVQSKPEVGKLPTKKLTQTPEIIPSNYNYTPQEPETIRTASTLQTVMEPDPNREGKFKVKELRQAPYSAYFPGEGWLPMNAPRVMYYNPTTGEETEERFQDGGLTQAQDGIQSQASNAPTDSELTYGEYYSQAADASKKSYDDYIIALEKEKQRVANVRKNIIPTAKMLDSVDNYMRTDDWFNSPEGQAYLKYTSAENPKQLEAARQALTPTVKALLPNQGKYNVARWDADENQWNPRATPHRELYCTPYGCFTYQKAGANDVPTIGGNLDFVQKVNSGSLPFEKIPANQRQPGDMALWVENSPADYTDASKGYIRRPHHTTIYASPDADEPNNPEAGNYYNADNGVRLAYGLTNYETNAEPLDRMDYYRYIGQTNKMQDELIKKQAAWEAAENKADRGPRPTLATVPLDRSYFNTERPQEDIVQVDYNQQMIDRINNMDISNKKKRKLLKDAEDAIAFNKTFQQPKSPILETSNVPTVNTQNNQTASFKEGGLIQAQLGLITSPFNLPADVKHPMQVSPNKPTVKRTGRTYDALNDVKPVVAESTTPKNLPTKNLSTNEAMALKVAERDATIKAIKEAPLLTEDQKNEILMSPQKLDEYSYLTRQQEPDTIKESIPYSARERAWDIATNPFDAFEYAVRTGDVSNMPRNYNQMRMAGIDPSAGGGANAVGNALNTTINLFDAGDKVVRNVGEGNYGTAALEAMRFIPGARLNTGASKYLTTQTPLKNVYNKVATGNSFLTDYGLPAWKVEKPNGIIRSSDYIARPYTDAEAKLLSTYGRGMRFKSQADWDAMEALTKSGATDFSKSDTPISRVLGYYAGGSDEQKAIEALRRGDVFATPAEKNIRTWSAGIPKVDDNFKGNTRLIIPSRYTKDLGSHFAGMPYYDKRVNFLWDHSVNKSLNYNAFPEKELMGNIPEGFKVIGTSSEDGMRNLIIKPLKKSGSPNAFTRSGLGGMDMSNHTIKNVDYYTQLLDTYNKNIMPAANRKFYKDLIATVKKQDGLVTERQLNQLKRLATGNFDFGSKGYNKGYEGGGYVDNQMTHFQDGGNMDPGNNALKLHMFYDKNNFTTGGTVEMMTDDEIKKYRDAGYVIIEEPDYE